MKGLIRKEWYSLWSQYRIHMLAMLGLGVLLPIIKNTDFIYNLYNTKEFKIRTFDKKYLVSFQNRNDKDAEHLLITNY